MPGLLNDHRPTAAVCGSRLTGYLGRLENSQLSMNLTYAVINVEKPEPNTHRALQWQALAKSKTPSRRSAPCNTFLHLAYQARSPGNQSLLDLSSSSMRLLASCKPVVKMATASQMKDLAGNLHKVNTHTNPPLAIYFGCILLSSACRTTSGVF